MSAKPEEISSIIKEQIRNYNARVDMRETGTVILEAFANQDPTAIPGVLVQSHGPFTWGKNAIDAVKNAIVLEEVAMMAYHTVAMNGAASFQQELADKHYFRKHGAGAYYGQKAKD